MNPGTRSPKLRWIAALALVILLGLGGWRLERTIESLQPRLQYRSRRLALPSARMVRALFLNYNGLAADIYWTRAVQYFGRLHLGHRRHYPLLWPLLRITQRLDPDLVAAAEYGSYFLADRPPLGAGEPQDAVRLLRRAIRRHPNRWRLYFDLGFVYALNLHQRRQAAEAFAAGALRPGANPVLYTLAAEWYGQVHQDRLALALWSNLYHSTRSRLLRENARDHILGLRARIAMRQLTRLVADYARRFHHPPAGWQSLIRAGLLPGVPLDPLGHAYRLLPGGQVALSRQSHLPTLRRVVPLPK